LIENVKKIGKVSSKRSKSTFKKAKKYENLNPNVWKFDSKRPFLTVSDPLASWSRDVGKMAKLIDGLEKDLKSLKSAKTTRLVSKPVSGYAFGCR
jgi:hypothetical protein